MAITEVPVVTFASVAGIVNTTAAAEIVLLFTALKTLVPATDHATAQASPPSGLEPNYDKWFPEIADQMRAEIDAFAVAIAAAPTS